MPKRRAFDLKLEFGLFFGFEDLIEFIIDFMFASRRQTRRGGNKCLQFFVSLGPQ